MSGAITLNGPNLGDYQNFIANVMGIPSTVLPATTPVIALSFSVAMESVNPALACVGLIYPLAVYNYAGDLLLNFATDQPGYDFFAKIQKQYQLATFVPGVLSTVSDEGTSNSWFNADAMRAFTLSDLHRLKTPYGRQYLQFAQSYGTLWGLS